MRPIRLLKPGDRFIRAADINEIIMELVRQGKFHLEGEGAELESGGSGMLLNVPKAERGIWAKITSGSNPYAWTEQDVGTGGTFSNKTNGRTGTTSQDPAYELNDNTVVVANSIVWMERVYINISGSTVSQEWTFNMPGGNSGMMFSGARLTLGAADSITGGGGFEAIAYDTAVLDTNSYFTATGRLTLAANTAYHAGAEVGLADNNTYDLKIQHSADGILVRSDLHLPSGDGLTYVNFSTVFKTLNAGYIEVQIESTNNTTINAGDTVFWLHKLGT